MNLDEKKAEQATETAEEKNSSLDIIRRDLKVPKSRRNDFGGYDYRSCEDILNALKPLLFQNVATINFEEEVVLIGKRYYLKATASFFGEDGLEESTTGFAREEETRKGMSADQITGSASSYARKYALNAMFLIDDSAEPDAGEPGIINSEEAAEIKQGLQEVDADIAKFLKWGGCESVDQLPSRLLEQARRTIADRRKKGATK